MVEIPTPKPYIFMIRVNRQIKCPNNLFFVLWNLMISWIVFILHRKKIPIHHTYIYSLVYYLFIKQDQRFWLATRLLHLWCFLDFYIASSLKQQSAIKTCRYTDLVMRLLLFEMWVSGFKPTSVLIGLWSEFNALVTHVPFSDKI